MFKVHTAAEQDQREHHYPDGMRVLQRRADQAVHASLQKEIRLRFASECELFFIDVDDQFQQPIAFFRLGGDCVGWDQRACERRPTTAGSLVGRHSLKRAGPTLHPRASDPKSWS